jgi:hypothetical protein
MFLTRIKESTQAFHSKLEQDLDIFHFDQSWRLAKPLSF